MVHAVDLALDLPAGWAEHRTEGGPFELRPRADDSAGVLQVSKFPAEQAPFICQQPSLGAVAETLGVGLGQRGQNWGRSAGHKEAPWGQGRLGVAVFQGGAFPAMFLCVTASNDSAWLWTFLGPNPAAEEVRQALGIVASARVRGATSA